MPKQPISKDAKKDVGYVSTARSDKDDLDKKKKAVVRKEKSGKLTDNEAESEEDDTMKSQTQDLYSLKFNQTVEETVDEPSYGAALKIKP